MVITSRENKIFKKAMLLKTSKGRSQEGLFVIEGIRSVRDAIQKGARLDAVIVKDSVRLDFECECPVYTFAPKLFDEVSETVTPQGIMAFCLMEHHSIHDVISQKGDCAVFCESLQDPGNIGTIIRTAHAAFCQGVVLSKGCCDLYNPKIIRSTMSSVMSVPVVTNADIQETVKNFKNSGYTIIAGALSENAVDFYNANLDGKHLIVIGNEGNGVSEELLSMCDKVLKIPMRNDAESLNAAVAGSVMIYEHYRQNIKIL